LSGLLHADPAPEAFRLDPVTGRCGVIDWSYFLHGPLSQPEIAHGLAPMLRFRWAVQADYFAWRVAENDLTGISGPEDNEKGLEDARRFLAR
jgi:hypothetical protein